METTINLKTNELNADLFDFIKKNFYDYDLKIIIGKNLRKKKRNQKFIPLTIEEYNDKLIQAEKSVKEGNLVDNEEVLIEIEKWMK